MLCEVQGWRVAAVYVDNDRSATNGKDRPEWERLLADVSAGIIDAIVVWNQDRGWRNSELKPATQGTKSSLIGGRSSGYSPLV